MVRIDLARRAQIGRDRRARTRAELMQAARRLYAARSFDSVTVDDVVNAAEVAKGTFYVHFDSSGRPAKRAGRRIDTRIRRAAAASQIIA